MPSKRASAKSATSGAGASSPSPALNAAVLGTAAVYGIWLLVSRGRMSWPPTDLVANLYTIAGCLALAGPIVLLRRDAEEAGVGETVWLTGGVLLWIFNVAALVKGEGRWAAIATPVSAATMGLIILAVLVASWRGRSGRKSWAWTNITGWALGVFWVGLAIASLAPGNPTRLAMR